MAGGEVTLWEKLKGSVVLIYILKLILLYHVSSKPFSDWKSNPVSSNTTNKFQTLNDILYYFGTNLFDLICALSSNFAHCEQQKEASTSGNTDWIDLAIL